MEHPGECAKAAADKQAECLKYGIAPFIIEDDLKLFYYRGLQEWDAEKSFLQDTCLTAQDRFEKYLDYFRIAYKTTCFFEAMQVLQKPPILKKVIFSQLRPALESMWDFINTQLP